MSASVVDEDWINHVAAQREAELMQFIQDENLKEAGIRKFVTNSFRNRGMQSSGADFVKILPPVSRFTPGGDLSKKIEAVWIKLKAYFDRFFDISGKEEE